MSDASLPPGIEAALLERSTRRRLFIKIEGYRPILWQPLDEIDPTTQEAIDFAVPGGGHPINSHLVALWRMDERAATTAPINYSKYGDTLGTSTLGSPPCITGTIIRARSCPTDSYNILVNTSSLLELQEFTICGWFKLDASWTPAYLDRVFRMGYRDTATSYMSYGLHVYTSSPLTLEFWCRTGTGANDGKGARTGTLNKDQWYHIACVWNGYGAKIYVDGVLSTNYDSFYGSYTPILYRAGGVGPRPLKFYGTSATDGASGEKANGALEDVAIYDKAYGPEWIWRASKSNNYERYGYAALIPPDEELSHDIDLVNMKVTPSSMNFKLLNIDDPIDPGKKLFAKLFAPQRWENSGQYSYLVRGTSSVTQLDANATGINVRDTTGWSTWGEAYIANECFSYTGIDTAYDAGSGAGLDFNGDNLDRLTGVTKGEYPALTTTNFGRTHKIEATPTGATASPYGATLVSTIPFSFIGREIGLYVTAWDHTNRCWYDEDDAILLWAGTISETIQYSSETNEWIITAEHFQKRLERSVAQGMATTSLYGVNITGSNQKCTVMVYNPAGPTVNQYSISLTGGYWGFNGYEQAASKICSAFNASAINSFYAIKTSYEINDSGNVALKFHKSTAGTLIITILPTSQTDGCHHFQVIGFPTLITFSIPGSSDDFVVEAPSAPFVDYHPWDYNFNGGNLYTTGGLEEFFSTQGDTGSGYAYAMIKKGGRPSGFWDNVDKPYVFTFSGTSGATMTGVYPSKIGDVNDWSKIGFVGRRRGEEYIQIQQIYRPHAFTTYYREFDLAIGYRGPFEILLYSLLSTGTDTYNDSTYDKLPLALSCGVQAALVDKASFLKADKEIGVSELSYRGRYVLYKGEEWLDMFHREGQLFGYVLVWDDGQFKLVNINSRPSDVATITLDASNQSTAKDPVTIDTPMSTVVNQFAFKFDYNFVTDKYGPEIIITDYVSTYGLGATKKATIVHPGVNTGGAAGTLPELIRTHLLSTYKRSRFPRQVVSRTLAPTLAHQVYPGMVVTYESDQHPDPLGSGSMSCESVALVLSVSWNYLSMSGNCKLLLYGETVTTRPWASAALFDQSATNGGWTSATKRIVLKTHAFGDSGTDSEDGTTFASGDKILIIERNPSDPTSPGAYSATVASTYETDGANTLTITTDPFSGAWDATFAVKEWIIVPDDYGTAVATQKSGNLYQGNATYWGLISAGGDDAHRYG